MLLHSTTMNNLTGDGQEKSQKNKYEDSFI